MKVILAGASIVILLVLLGLRLEGFLDDVLFFGAVASLSALAAFYKIITRAHSTGSREDPPASAEEEFRCEKCGYILIGLPFPRCPECGSAIGFRASFEELGVRREELRDRDAKADAGDSERGNTDSDKSRS